MEWKLESQFLLFYNLYGPMTKFNPGAGSKDVCVMSKSKMAAINQLKYTYFMYGTHHEFSSADLGSSQ